jgi:hypothetical protein
MVLTTHTSLRTGIMIFFDNSAKKLSPAQAKLVQNVFNFATNGGLEPVGGEVIAMRKLRKLGLVKQVGRGKNNWTYEIDYSKFECVQKLGFASFYE